MGANYFPISPWFPLTKVDVVPFRGFLEMGGICTDVTERGIFAL